MNLSKYIILLSALVLLPLFVKAQIRPVTKRQAEQIGKKVYITSTGDTTLVVNPLSQGLKNPNTQFLFRDKTNAELDSILSDEKSSYTSLEAATLDVDRLLREVESEQKASKGTNNALSFRIASKNRNMRKKELEAREIADDIIRKDRSVQELAALYAMFGDKPTYYINGVEVPQSVVNQLYPTEVIERDMRVADTASGNPNGEIWLSVTEKALNRIKLPISMAYNSSPEVTVYTGANKNLSSYIKEVEKIEREKSRATLKSLPVVKRETTADGKQIDRVVPINDKSTQNQDKEQQTDESAYGTRIISRTVNNQKADTKEETQPVTSTAPRTSTPVIRRIYDQSEKTNTDKKSETERDSDTHQTSPSKIDNEEQKEDKTPKKSVRRIKERHQNQNQDGPEID